jgi:hypothetical protein
MEVHQVRELQLRIQTQHRAVCSQLRILMSWPRLRAPLKAEAHHRRYEEAPICLLSSFHHHLGGLPRGELIFRAEL